MIVQEANPRSASFDYVPTLDGWRALSVIAVIFYHCLHNGLDPGSIWSSLALRGHVGVDVFFAISGFLICGKLLEELRDTKTISLKNFYVRRCFRILPAIWGYLATLAMLTASGWVKTWSWEFGSTLLFVRNYFPLFHKEQVFGTYTAQFWSLAVEEHFYLLCPITMLFVGPKICRIRWAGLILALGLFAWRTIDAAHGWLIPFGVDVNSKTDTRLDALLWGCLAATMYPYLRARLNASTLKDKLWLPTSLMVALVIFPRNFPGDSLIKAVLFPALIMSTAIAPETVLGRFLELPVMKWIGRLSYSIYIWQQLAIFPVVLSKSPLRYMQHFPVNIGVIFIVACGSYYLLERPMIRTGHKLTRRVSAGSMANSEVPESASVVYHDADLSSTVQT
jgi:peptidoglycan/LPS O-acetylase OafA/YrhL